MSLHSTYGASGAERYLHCPGSVRMSRDAPEPITSIYAAEGTRAHAAAAHRITTGRWPEDTPEERREYLQPYIDLIEKYARSSGPRDFL